MAFFRSVRQWFGFQRQDLPDRPEAEERATRSAVQTMQVLTKYLPNPDLILQKTGKPIDHMKDLTYDDEVFSCVEYLQSALREYEWELQAGPDTREEDLETVQAWMEAWDWDRIDAEIADARNYGYQPFEIDWTDENGLWRPAHLVGKPQQWFGFTPENDLGLRTGPRVQSDVQTLPPGKFVVGRNTPSYTNPYGESALSRVFWPVQFKKGTLRQWITFAERHATDKAVGRHPPRYDDAKVKSLLDQLENLIQDSVAAVPDDESIDILSADKQGSSEVYQALMNWCEGTIQKVLLSSTLTTDSGDVGSYALGSAQIENVSGAIVGKLRRMKEQVIEDVLRLIWHFNFNGADAAPTLRTFQQQEPDKERAERDRTLTEAGVSFTASYWQREYNLQEDDFEVVEVESRNPAPAPGFTGDPERGLAFADATAEGGQAAVDELLDAMIGDDARNQELMEGTLEEPIEMIQDGSDPEVVMQELAGAYPDMDASGLEDLLRSLFFVADVWGRLSEEQEAEE